MAARLFPLGDRMRMEAIYATVLISCFFKASRHGLPLTPALHLSHYYDAYTDLQEMRPIFRYRHGLFMPRHHWRRCFHGGECHENYLSKLHHETAGTS